MVFQMLKNEGLEKEISQKELVLTSYNKPSETEHRRDEILLQKLTGEKNETLTSLWDVA